MNNQTDSNEEKKHSSDPPSGQICGAASCSAWRFKFSAQHPPESSMVGGTYLEGNLECEPEDLPEAAVAILKNAFGEWDTEGQTHISLNIEPNAISTPNPTAPTVNQ